jgi:23S rRNA (adenine2503-C2)-methyltransferase
MPFLLGMNAEELTALMGEGTPAYRGRQLYEALYRRRITSLSEVAEFPKAVRERLAGELELGYPRQVSRFESTDGTRRYLLGLADGRTVEAVFMPEETRDTLCISSQVGCPVDCKFCLTALMGLERNLTAGEIIGQVLHLARDNNLWPNEKRINIVMMGQGEPLLNLPHVARASAIFADPRGLNISPRRITVSTSGILPRMAEFAAMPNSYRPRLAISLNASSEEARRSIMPITRKWHLAELLEACRAYPLRPWEKLSFEYVLLGGVNDSDADARRLIRLVANINCKVNLIALNPGPGIPFSMPAPERVASFQAIVRKAVPCFVRRPRGRDIFAACGQLKRMSSEPQLVSIQ